MTRATARVPARVTAGGSPRTGATRAGSARTTPRAVARPELRLVPAGPAAGARRRAPRALRHPRAPFVLFIVAMLVGTTLGLLILNTAIAVDSLKATGLRAENAARAQEVQRLERQVVSGGTPAEIAAAAVAAGLVPAGPAAYLVIDPDGGAVLRGTPAPAGGPDGGASGNGN
jgi:hypothetical protein